MAYVFLEGKPNEFTAILASLTLIILFVSIIGWQSYLLNLFLLFRDYHVFVISFSYSSKHFKISASGFYCS